MTYTVYLAGPMSNIPAFNFHKFFAAAEYLRDVQGWDVLSPAEKDLETIPWDEMINVPGFDTGDLAQYVANSSFTMANAMEWDLPAIMKSDGIVLLDGWETSTGARGERAVAEALDRDIWLLQDNPAWPQWHLGRDREPKQLTTFMKQFGAPAVTAAESPALAEFKAEHPEIPWSANLGCATTRQLLAEVSARMQRQNSINGRLLADLCSEAVTEKWLAKGILDYRTSDCGEAETVPSFQQVIERELVLREAEVAAEHERILRSIVDPVVPILVVPDEGPSCAWPQPTVPPIGTHIAPPRVTDDHDSGRTASGLNMPYHPGYTRADIERDTVSGEVRVIDPNTGGAKGAKAQAMHLLPGDALLAISEHLNKGAQKYAERNWEKGYAWSLSFAAMQRHLWAWWQGEDEDAEFGWSHLRAVGFHALVLLALELRGAGTDDRPGAHCQCCGDGSETPAQPGEVT